MAQENTETKKQNPYAVKYSVNENPNALWYVVHTYSGHERKVAITLGERARVMELSDQILESFIPTQKKILISSNKKKEVDDRLFPGYILVKAEINDKVWHTIRNTPGVTGFVGVGNSPTPLSKKEVDAIINYIKLDTPRFESKFNEGDAVRIVDGAFKDFIGKVNKVMKDQGRLEVLVPVFDRETPVEVDLSQVEPA
jgi:transcriptional antiterminator NusG